MKIAFAIGSPAISGGTFVIFEYVKGLLEKGHEVIIITDFNVNDRWISWYPEAKNFRFVNYLAAKNILFDLVIGTWWKTIPEIHKLKSKNYVYFVQSYEPFFVPESEFALRKYIESTYLRDLPVITEATWIKDILKKRYNTDSKLVKNGIRKEIFKPFGESIRAREEGKLRVLIEGPIDVHFKNVPRTIELCRESKADEIWLLTSSDIESYKGVDKVFSKVSIFDTPLIYRSCDVIVKLSYVEGMFGPPLEMFHCGGTAIVYDVTGHDEYISHNNNALVVKTGDEAKVVKFINNLKEDGELLHRLKIGALETAKQWPDWTFQVDKFENSIFEICKGNSTSRRDLELRENFFGNWYYHHEINIREIRESKLYGLEIYFRKLKIKIREKINRLVN